MARRRPSLAVRAGRSALLVLALAAALHWAIPRVVPRLFGRGVFLREEFFHPAAYHVGGLDVAGRTLGGRTVDCTRLVRPAPAPGRNALANPGLDGPCGWGFAPHLGAKAAGPQGEGADGWFRLAGREGHAFQEVRLGALAPLADRGELAVTLSGSCRADAGVTPQVVLEALGGPGPYPGTIGSRALRPAGDHGRWNPVAGTWELPPGTRVLRVTLRAVGSGAAAFDALALVPRRVIAASSLDAGAAPPPPR